MTITVVGGTYREYCVEPAIDRLVGSGLRAAGLLASLGDDVTYITAVDEHSAPEFDAVCASLAVPARTVPRTGPIAFTYETPIHRTTAHGHATAEPLSIQGGTVLAFGMVETTWAVNADTVVIDPQHSGVNDLLKSVEARRITLILNEHEARAAADQSHVEQAALELLGQGVDAVVVKRGALGGLVAHGDTITTFGAIPTSTVHPLGSGDAFSAGFVHAWADGADPLTAAQFGSQVAAAHSLTGTPQISRGALDSLGQPLPYPTDATPRVYLAGPFFNTAQRHLIRTIRAALIHLGAEVFSPLDEIGPGGDEVAEKDLQGLQGCQSVLAVLDGADPGTLFEVGWATHAQIPVTGFAEHPTEHTWTMARGTGTTVNDDLSSALYNSVWSAIAASVAP
ncbi:nucleoside 2-deoxyribosyltransferase [Mycobacteroides abscessus subsp. massiliense]|uniref:PfkB family carbohydrate kinase n=1 Tax=Mycobacteroides abscessus TaxID=36809 RepID=UPI0019D27461|nr:PfkB family carbohydrate kinase [Mycobacteroides abscessus]MBN7315800.1 nucleoside 2-deoxyribosyltransferase [Mycobacteroides abscessus subsp. massiliense]